MSSVRNCCVGTCGAGAGAADHHRQRRRHLHSSNDHCTGGGRVVRMLSGRSDPTLGGEGWARTTSLNDSRRGRQRSTSAFMLRSPSPITIFLLSMYSCKEHWHSGHLKPHSFALAWHWEMYAHTLSLGACAREKNSAHAPTIQHGPITTLLTISIASAVESCLNSCLLRHVSMRCYTSVLQRRRT